MMNDNFSHDELNEINYLLEELQRLEAVEAQQNQYSYANGYVEEEYDYYESSSHAQQPTSSAAMAEEVGKFRKTAYSLSLSALALATGIALLGAMQYARYFM